MNTKTAKGKPTIQYPNGNITRQCFKVKMNEISLEIMQ